MTTRQQHARDLYFGAGKTQKEIAAEVGVAERTVQYWIARNQWQRLRDASLQMPAIIAENYCMQVIELQNAIAQREPGKRYPTKDEAEILRKLTAGMEKMKRYPTASSCKQMFETFRDYIRPADPEFCRKFFNYEDSFLQAKAQNGFQPWDMEYKIAEMPPIDPHAPEATDEAEPIAPTPVSSLAPGETPTPQSTGTAENIQPAIITAHPSQNNDSQSDNIPSIPYSENDIIRKNTQKMLEDLGVATGEYVDHDKLLALAKPFLKTPRFVSRR